MRAYTMSRRHQPICALAACFVLFGTSLAARAQSLSVNPVNIFMAPGETATTLTVTNHGNSGTAIQIRAYAWSQQGDDDQLTATNEVVVSPPLATIGPGSDQVVRLILRHAPKDRESTYRIVLDQIPPPAESGIVHIVLRMSIPIFALPVTRATPHPQFHAEINAGQLYLVAVNDGLRHERIRDIDLTASDGRKLKEAPGLSPYLLAGVTRRWNIVGEGALPSPGETLRLSAQSDGGKIEEQVRVIPTQSE
jgi:fimbrial chaperone protein